MLLGAPVAAALACKGDRARALPPGELVDTGMARGHAALRTVDPTGASPPPRGQSPQGPHPRDLASSIAAASPVVPPERRRRARVAIVGAGAAGLAAAWSLRRAGIQD